MFHQRGAALDPIAVIAVKNIVDLTYFSLMDVSAHDTLHVAGFCGVGDRGLILADE